MKNIYQKILVGYLVFLIIYWATLHLTHQTGGIYNYIYSFLFSLVPLVGGFVGMIKSRIWGALKSQMGRALFFIALGLFCWGFGSMIWSYYNIVLNIAAPYPSLADLGFAPSVFFYGLGAVYLSRVIGARYGFRNKHGKIFAAVAIAVLLAVSYYVLVVFARGGVLIPQGETTLKAILDIAYPLGDFLSLSLSVVIAGLSLRFMGGGYLYNTISILLGLSTMFVADSVFSYTTTVGTFYNGDFGDLLLTLGLFLLTFVTLGFSTFLKDK